MKSRIVTVVMIFFVILSGLLLFSPLFVPQCDIIKMPAELFCEQRNLLLNFSAQNITVTLLGGLFLGGLGFLLNLLWKNISPNLSFREDYFPFKQLLPVQLTDLNNLNLFKWSPGFDKYYIDRQDKKTTLAIKKLGKKPYILLVGIEGSGKTREAIELINRLDLPKNTSLAVIPTKANIDDLLDWPANLSSQNVVLFFDSLDKFVFIEGDKEFEIDGSVDDFSRILSKIIGRFEKYCDKVTVIGSIRTGTKAWNKINNQVSQEKGVWKNFNTVELMRRNKDEAIQYCAQLASIFPNIEFNESGINSLAEKYDGTFASIRLYLQLKDDSYQRKTPFKLTSENVSDFVGVYPKDWEQKYYNQKVKGKSAPESIFKALSIISQLQITPYKKMIISLAAALMNTWGFQFWKRYQVETALLGMNEWINNNDDILNTPEAYINISGRISFYPHLEKVCNALIDCSRDGKYKYKSLHDLFSFSGKLSRTLNHNQLALKLAYRTYEIDSRNARILHNLAIIYDKLGENVKAIDFCNRALDVDINYQAAYATLGVSLSKNKMLGDARKVLEQGLKLFPYSVSILIPLAIVLDQLNLHVDAIKYLKYAVEIDPENLGALKSLSIAYHRQGLPSESVKYLERALLLQPDNESVYEVAVRLLPNLDKHARDDLLKKITLSDSQHIVSLATYKERCKFFWLIGAETALRTQLQKINSLRIEFDDEFWSVGDLYGQIGDHKSAIRFYKQALVINESHYKSLVGLGDAYSLLEDDSNSIKYYSDAIIVNPEDYQALVGLSHSYLRSRKFIEAEKFLIKALSINKTKLRAWVILSKIPSYSNSKVKDLLTDFSFATDNPRMLIAISVIQRKCGMIKQAEENASFAKHFTEKENSSFAWLKLAETLRDLDLLDEAINAYQQVIRLMPDNALAYSYLASTYIKRSDPALDDFGNAEKSIKKSIELGMDSKESLATYGVSLSRQGNYETALTVLNESLAIDSEFGFAWSEIGQIYGKKANPEDALKAFQKAIECGFEDPNTLNGLGMAAKQLGLYEIARSAFLASIELKDNHQMSWSHLGETYLKEKKYEESIGAFKKSINLDEKNGYAWSGMGQAYNKLNRFEDSIYAHQRALEIDTTNYSNYYGLGHALSKIEQMDEAIAAHIKSVKLNSMSPSKNALIDICATLSIDASKSGTFNTLVKKLTEENIFPNDFDVVKAEKILELAENRDLLAIPMIEKLLLTQPSNPKVYNIMSSAYRHLKMYPDAIETANKAISIAPNLASTWYTLGRAYEESINYVEAKMAFEKALEVQPDYPKAVRARERIKGK